MLLLAYDQNCESALSDGLLRLLRRVGGGCYDDGGCRKKDVAGLVVEGHCLGALLRLNRIERDKLRGRLLLNDGDVSSPLEMKASPSFASQPAATVPEPVAKEASTLAVETSSTCAVLLWSPTKMRWFFLSIASPVGPVMPSSGIWRFTSRVFGSKAQISLLS